MAWSNIKWFRFTSIDALGSIFQICNFFRFSVYVFKIFLKFQTLFFCWMCWFLWKCLIIFFIPYFKLFYILIEIKWRFCFPWSFSLFSLNLALRKCFLQLLVWSGCGLSQGCRMLHKITAQSDGLSTLKMKSWFTSSKGSFLKDSTANHWVKISDTHLLSSTLHSSTIPREVRKHLQP